MGHFLKTVNDQRLGKSAHIKASNYAAPGNTVEDDLSDQLSRFFVQFPKKNGDQSIPSLDPSRTLYVFWLGINDCGRTETEDLEEIVETLFTDGLDEVYTKAGARNFLLINVPPKDRCPALKLTVDLSERYKRWNELLQSHAKTFAAESSQVSVFLFSAYDAITAVLDDPNEFDFQEEDVAEEGGAIWLDELHLTNEVHLILAKWIAEANVFQIELSCFFLLSVTDTRGNVRSL